VIAPRIKTLALAVVGALAIAVLSGCDANENADLENGAALFGPSCGTCHKLKHAATTSDVGPDLDAAFADARASGMDQDTIEGVVESQIENPRQVSEEDPSYMPPNILEGQDAEDVSAYIASVAGVPGIKPPEFAGGPGGQVFNSNGCGACHILAAAETVGTQGPNLDENLPGQSADDIQQSIIAPSSEIVQGFPDIMPQTYEDSIPPEDLKVLVKFLVDEAGKTSAANGN